jgi:signal transduction histidine kinase
MDNQLLSDVRHDIKSPLAGIKALTQLLTRSLDKNEIDKAKDMANRLNQRIDEMVEIINTQMARLGPR